MRVQESNWRRWRIGEIEIDAQRIVDQRHEIGARLIVGDELRCRNGDYLLRFSDGELEVMPKATFERVAEPLEERTELEVREEK